MRSHALRTRPAALLAFLALAIGVPSRAAEPAKTDEVRARYTKYEYRIPMRDGVRLFTAVYVPKDGSEKVPILLTRTPYGVSPYGPDQYKSSLGPSDLFLREGYIFAYQDVRGRLMSEGEFVNVRPHKPVRKGSRDIDESTDTWDTIDWLVKNVAGNNGRVGIWGISYPGLYAAHSLPDSHPALKAVSPQAPIADWFLGDDFRHHGAFYLPHAFNFFSSFGTGRSGPTTKGETRFEHSTPDGYSYFLRLPPLAEVNAKLFDGKAAFWDELLQHETYDAFWQERNLLPHLRNVKPAVLVVGGWFDAENLFGALALYRALRSQSPATSVRLVMGPWIHGGWARTDGDALGPVRFNDKTSLRYRSEVELPFFNFHLKGKGELRLAEATAFESGTHVWRSFETWPPRPARPRSLYFRAAGKLSFEPPQGDEPEFDEYQSDPNRPVPFVPDITVSMAKEYMTADQRFAGTRPDVLVYQSEPLEEDVTLAGPVAPRLVVSTSGTDSDWVVKLVDVYPDDFPDPDPNPAGVKMGGYQQLLRGEVMRGKFRSSYERPEPFVPGQPTHVEFTMPDVFHTFRRGHRILVQVQSSWFPLVDRNPQTFMSIPKARPEDFQKATQRVYRSKSQPSRLEVNVLPAASPVM